MMAKLVAIGIKPGFQIQTGGPERFGKFYGVMGNLIRADRIQDAKNSAADENFWFRQGH